jgi:thiol-disulfide isomerase/thioredoxin
LGGNLAAMIVPLFLLLLPWFDSASTPHAKPLVLLFVRTDCPISNRYAPEMERIYEKYSAEGFEIRSVYPEPGLSSQDMNRHQQEYGLRIPATLDANHHDVDKAKATVTPEAAVFVEGKLVYRGRIDNWYIDIGKSRPKATEHSLEDVLQLIKQGKIPSFRETRTVGCVIEPVQ